MIILVKGNYIDFEAPIQMTDEQKKKFIEFMNKEFENVETEKVEEKTKDMGEREITTKKWENHELFLLLSPKSNEELANKTKRSIMSIKMMRGQFVPEFMVWAKKKDYSLPVRLETIEEFLKESN